MIFEIMASIRVFLVYLTLALVIHAHLTFELCLDNPTAICGKTFSDNLVLSYGLLFSQLDNYTEFPPMQMILLVIFSLVIPIVLANFLIAIMSNTYDTLNNLSKASDMKCLTSMCIEHENVICSYKRFTRQPID